MRKVKFCLSTTDKLLSKVIRFFQGTSVSHSFVEFESRHYDTTLAYEAKGLSSYVINREHVDGHTVYEFETEVSDELYFEIMKYIFHECGVPYAWKELFGFAAVRIAGAFCIKIKNPWPQPGKVCSSSCGEVLVRFFGVTPDVDYDDMDLNWLLDKLKSHPSFRQTKG